METAELQQKLQKEIRSAYRLYRKNEIGYNEWSPFIDRIKAQYGSAATDALSAVLNHANEVQRRLRDYKSSDLFRFRIRKYCNQYFHTDIEPWEVLQVISEKKVLIRKMDAVIKSAPKEFHAGGFSGNFSDNDEQRWECKSNPENYTEVITLTKNGWGGGRFRMSDKPVKFYDYNF